MISYKNQHISIIILLYYIYIYIFIYPSNLDIRKKLMRLIELCNFFFLNS